MPTSDNRAHTRRQWWLWCAVLAYCALIFALSAIPGDAHSNSAIWKYDKVAHAAEYGLLGILLWLALRSQFPGSRGAVLGAFALLLSALYAASDEWHQSFVPGRSPSLLDLLADVVGAATCISMSVFVAHRKRKRVPPEADTFV